jgi:DNA mismatch repair protein MutS2
MLSELGASRAALDHEKQEAQRLRAESEAVRSRYARKLEQLSERRDQLYRSMREDLDRAFREAHEQVAQVVRDVQSGGTSQQAARGREGLIEIQQRARDAEEAAGLAPEPTPPPRPIDWQRAGPGDPVVVSDAGLAVLVALPDRRGRVAVRLGSARVLVPMERVGAAPPGGPNEPQPRGRGRGRVQGPTAADDTLGDAGAGTCDLRGMRVDDALDRLVESLDRAASDGRGQLLVIHGIGTGALRRAVREHLARSPYVARFIPGGPEEGGEGVTTAHLEGG